MSCNGCRVLRKGCSESCILRPCLQWIESAEAQANATVFVAKFFGRAGLMSFITAVANDQRPALFQSLLYEACGRTVNPVSGAVGLLWTGNWHVCQEAVETVLRGCTLRPLTELPLPDLDEATEAPVRAKVFKRECDDVAKLQSCDLDLCLSSGMSCEPAAKRPDTPSVESEGSVTTTFMNGGEPMIAAGCSGGDRKLLSLFV